MKSLARFEPIHTHRDNILKNNIKKYCSYKNGISLIALIITIIVIIILAAVVVASSLNTPERANWAKFTSDYSNMQEMIHIKQTELYGKYAIGQIEMADGRVPTKAEIYEEIATGILPATGEAKFVNEIITFGNTSYMNINKPSYDGSWYITSNGKLYYSGFSYDGKLWSTPTSNEFAFKDDYIRDGLILWFDGIYNTSSGHSSDTTIWEDISGNENDGTLINFKGTATSGFIDNALIFDGINNWVMSKQINPQYVTIDLLYSYDNNRTYEQLFASNVETGGYALGATPNNVNINGYVYVDGAYRKTMSLEPIVMNTTQKHTLTYDGSEVKLYENGNNLLATNSIVGTIKPPTGNTVFALGTNPNGSTPSTPYMKGKIYTVRVYNRALTSEEIAKNHDIDKIRYGL